MRSVQLGAGASRNLAAGTHGFERGRNDLRHAGALNFVGRRELQQLRVRQDDPELVVQTMKQNAELGADGRRARPIVCRQRGRTHACVPAAGALSLSEDCELAVAGSRHNVSAKMRIDPPAVRTYSTFPAEIQL